MHWWSLSVGLSVPCLTLCREWKGMTSWKLAGRMMTCDPIQSLKVQGWGNFDVAQLVCFYRDVNVQWTISIESSWVAVQFTTCRGPKLAWCSPHYGPQPHGLFSVMSVSRNLTSSHIIPHLNVIFAVHLKRQSRRLPRCKIAYDVLTKKSFLVHRHQLRYWYNTKPYLRNGLFIIMCLVQVPNFICWFFTVIFTFYWQFSGFKIYRVHYIKIFRHRCCRGSPVQIYFTVTWLREV